MKYFHLKQPVDHRVKRNTWLTLAIDCYSFMAAWKGTVCGVMLGQTFRSIDQIVISAYCKLRRIFTMRDKLIEFSNDDEAFEEKHGGVFVPKNFQLNADVLQTTQVIVYEGLEEMAMVKEVSNVSSLANSSVKTAKKQSPMVSQAHGPMGPRIDDKKTVTPNLSKNYPEPAVSKISSSNGSRSKKSEPEVSSHSSFSPTSSMKKSNLSAKKGMNEKQNHPIPEHKEDEECDELQGKEYGRHLKKELGKYEKQ